MKKITAVATVAALLMSSAAFAGGYSKKGATPIEPVITPPAVIQPSSGPGSLGAGAALPIALGVLAIAAIAASDSDDSSNTTTTTE